MEYPKMTQHLQNCQLGESPRSECQRRSKGARGKLGHWTWHTFFQFWENCRILPQLNTHKKKPIENDCKSVWPFGVDITPYDRNEVFVSGSLCIERVWLGQTIAWWIHTKMRKLGAGSWKCQFCCICTLLFCRCNERWTIRKCGIVWVQWRLKKGLLCCDLFG